MKNQMMRGLVTSVTKVSPTLSRVTFRLSGALKYLPGQTVWIGGGNEDSLSPLRGFYPLVGCPNLALKTNQYEIHAEINSVSQLMKGQGILRPGELIKVEGPFGGFWPLTSDVHQPIVWIASEKKQSLFLSVVRSQLFKKADQQKILLLIEVDEESQVCQREIFEAKGITVIPCVKKPDRWVDGYWGKISSLLRSPKFRLDASKAHFFIAAESETIQEVRSVLIYDKQVSLSQITQESQLKQNHSEEITYEKFTPWDLLVKVA